MLGRLLSGVLGRPGREGAQRDREAERRETTERLEAARQRLKQEIPQSQEEPDSGP
jgi:hypothetical protein